MVNRRELLTLRGATTTLPLGRRFVLAYAILVAMFDVSVLLPGNLYTSSVEDFVVGVGIQALIVWRLWHGSSLAWLLAMFFAAGMVFSLILMQPDPEADVITVLVLSVAQVLILWMYALTRDRPLSSSVGIPPEALGRQ
jgi:hypothetical protein